MNNYRKSETYILYAWLIALVATLAAIFIGEIMGQMPCQLCWYQRIAMFPLAIILGTASFKNDLNIVFHALPIALVGGGIAAWHSLLYAGMVPEPIRPCSQTGPSCSGEGQTIFGFLSLPYLSFTAFTLITICLAMSLKWKKNNE